MEVKKTLSKAIRIIDSIPSRLSGLKWPNGSTVSESDMLKAIMYQYGESMAEAKEDLMKIDRDKLQRFINYYASKH